jgi:serine/threonine-protein kinase
MLRLTTLGATDLRDRHGHPIRDVLSQPKRVALLVYLAVEGSKGPVSRDRVLALFWPESDDTRARNTLSQSLHHLRQSLGAGVIESQGANAVEVHGEHLWCDATVFTEALERGDVELALDLYRGEFCPTLFVSGAPEVEQWMDAQRRRLRGLALAAVRTQAERLAARGDMEPAARAARRALALQPDDERDVRVLLALLERCGDVAGALLAYQEFARRLAEGLETEPAAETRQLVAAMRQRRRGASVEESPATAVAAAPAPVALASPTPGPRRLPRGTLFVALALGVATAGAWWALGRRTSAPRPDPRLVMVAPFRVAGADSALGFLREGMLDLLAAKLTGEGGLRAADPRTTVSMWPHGTRGRMDELADSAAVRVARSIGAGRLLLGSVVGRSEQVTLTATLLETARSRVRAQVIVTGRLDSLPMLVDALAARVLSEGAGEPALRLPSLTSTSLPALKAYLDGRSAFRAGLYDEAASDLQQAVDLDSSFAIAWAQLVWVSDWLANPDVRVRASPVAWSLRQRLGVTDRALLVATLRPRFPSVSSRREALEAWQNAVRVAPERPDAWYGLGDTYFHLGQLLGQDSGFAAAEAALTRAVALDSSFTAPLGHLVQIAILRRDTSAVRRLHRLYAGRDSTSEAAAYLRWHVAITLGDSATARSIETALDTLPIGVLYRIAGWAQVDGAGIETAWRAARLASRRASPQDAVLASRVLQTLAINTGHFAERLAATRQWYSLAGSRFDSLSLRAGDAVWSDGDPAVGRALLEHDNAPMRASFGSELACAMATWRVLHGGEPADSAGEARLVGTCLRNPAADLAARVLMATGAGAQALRTARLELDSARERDTGSGTGNFWSYVEGLMLLKRGAYAPARDAFRRREVGGGQSPTYWAPMLRLEGRAAELAGDTAGAVHAYRHYLALRYAPDPGARLYADSVRVALGRLEHRSRS